VQTTRLHESLEQWFPTGVPRHPAVPVAMPRGVAS